MDYTLKRRERGRRTKKEAKRNNGWKVDNDEGKITRKHCCASERKAKNAETAEKQ